MEIDVCVDRTMDQANFMKLLTNKIPQNVIMSAAKIANVWFTRQPRAAHIFGPNTSTYDQTNQTNYGLFKFYGFPLFGLTFQL